MRLFPGFLLCSRGSLESGCSASARPKRTSASARLKRMSVVGAQEKSSTASRCSPALLSSPAALLLRKPVAFDRPDRNAAPRRTRRSPAGVESVLCVLCRCGSVHVESRNGPSFAPNLLHDSVKNATNCLERSRLSVAPYTTRSGDTANQHAQWQNPYSSGSAERSKHIAMSKQFT